MAETVRAAVVALPLRVAVMAGSTLAATSVAGTLRGTGESLVARALPSGSTLLPGELAMSLVARADDVQATLQALPAGAPLLWLLDEQAAGDAAVWPLLAVASDPPRASGWLGAWEAPVRWLAALAALAQGLSVLDPSFARRLHGVPHAAARREAAVELEGLTAREEQVLELLSRGVSNREIADALAISPHTAKFHVAQILDKLGATSRTEAVSLALRRGLIGL